MKPAVTLLVLTALAGAATAQVNSSVEKAIGKPLPSFKMTSTKGETMTNASLKGKVVLLDFWATWCGPCKAASPAVQRLHANYGAKGLRAIGADTFESGPSGAAKYAKEHGYTYTFGVKGDALASAMGAQAIPLFVLVDKKGIVRKVWTGVPNGDPNALYASIEPEVQKLLKD